MSELKDMTGKTLYRFTVIKREPNSETNQARWLCRCRCGTYRIVEGRSLRSGHHKSCGCLLHEPEFTPWKKHGMWKSSTYSSWSSMKERCLNKTASGFNSYGGKGITVCERWMIFENFFADMGERPDGTTLDRYPNHAGNYEPENCRWATPKQQARNRKDNRLITAYGEIKNIAEWADDPRVGVTALAIRARLNNGWEPVRAVMEPDKTGWRKGVLGGWK